MPNVKLYRNTSDVNCFHKNIELLADIDCDFKAPINVETPKIIVRGMYHNANYFYIPMFNRYYFVTELIGLSDNLLQISGLSDVLSSNDITKLTAIVERQEFKRNTKLIDNELLIQSNNNFICHTVGNPVINDYNIYITTCGGESNNV